MLKRVPDWRFRLGQMIESGAQLQFEWGSFDCALHVCNCIRAITIGGVDPAEGLRGTYHDEAGAAAIYGTDFQSFIAGMAERLECPEIPPTFATRGDVVFIDNDTPQGAVGVIGLDGRFATCAAAKGFVLVPINRWKRAWKIG